MYKRAQNDMQFERSFADLAFSVLRDKVPKLISYLIGFQVIDKDEDETKAIGVFGFKYDKNWFYAPVFFINGELKGSELLFVKAMKAFVPLQENWINYILSKKTYTAGEPAKNSDEVRRNVMPDFSPFRTSPLAFGKYGSFNRTGYWCQGSWFDIDDIMQCFGESPSMEKYSAAVERMALPNVLHDLGVPAVQKLASMARSSTSFTDALRTFYPEPSDLLYKFALDKQSALQVPQPKAPVVPVNKGELIFITKEAALDGDKAFDALSDSERKQLVDEGVAIRDSRTDKTRVFSASVGKSVQNPDTTGVYQVLGRGGEMFDAIVATSPMSIGEGSCTYATVIRKSDGVFTTASRNDIFVVGSKEDGDLLKGAVSLSDMARDKHYVLTDGKRTSIPVQVVTKNTSNGVTTVHVSESTVYLPCGSSESYKVGIRPHTESKYDPVPVTVPKDERPEYAKDDEGYYRMGRPVVTNEKLHGMHNIGNTLFCGPDVKAVPVVQSGNIALGAMPDFESAMYKIGGLEKVSVYHHAGRYQLRDSNGLSLPQTRLEFITGVMSNHGVGEADARDMVKGAQFTGSETFFFKRSSMGGPSIASEADVASSYDGAWGAQVAPFVSNHQALTALQGTYNRDIYNPDPKLDRKAIDMAMSAARTGQKDVFDAGVITSLVKTIDVGALTDKYLANLMLGLDRVGRILFMYYWHHDKFVDRYGQEEMSELEDSLKNTFKSVGDVVLFLKKKMADPDQLSTGTDIKLDQVSDE
jgi:hypothetical protein